MYTSRLEVFRRHGVVFRQCQWVAEQDHGDHSPHHSEYDIQVPEDYGFPPERVDTFLNATDLALGHPADGYRLVQHRYWYRLDDINYSTCNLFDREAGRDDVTEGGIHSLHQE